MKPRFIEYLEYLKPYVKKNQLATLRDSQKCVLDAENGDISRLAKLFNDFPLNYVEPFEGRNKIFSAVCLPVIARWIRSYEKLITQGIFEITTKGKKVIYSASYTTEESVKRFIEDILIKARVDILDDNGMLKKEVVQFFGLNKLLDKHADEPLKIKEITSQLIYSYWMQLVLVNIGLVAIMNDCDVEQLERVNGFSNTLLCINKEFTYFFNDILYASHNITLNNDLEDYLSDFPIKEIDILHVSINH